MYFGQKRVRVLSSGLHSPKENAEGWKRVPRTVFAGLRKLSTLLFSWKQRCFNAVLASPSTTPSYEQEKKQLPMIVPLPSLGRGHKWVRTIGTWETLRNQTFSKTLTKAVIFENRVHFRADGIKGQKRRSFVLIENDELRNCYGGFRKLRYILHWILGESLPIKYDFRSFQTVNCILCVRQ